MNIVLAFGFATHGLYHIMYTAYGDEDSTVGSLGGYRFSFASLLATKKCDVGVLDWQASLPLAGSTLFLRV